ncbi:MAG: hypothetical protein IT303_01640 [Dehalococcoidia bacterium]|nr:hypothetical protein [Dehalococcoidia bacterium]
MITLFESNGCLFLHVPGPAGTGAVLPFTREHPDDLACDLIARIERMHPGQMVVAGNGDWGDCNTDRSCDTCMLLCRARRYR